MHGVFPIVCSPITKSKASLGLYFPYIWDSPSQNHKGIDIFMYSITPYKNTRIIPLECIE